jgi:hypothetical protein
MGNGQSPKTVNPKASSSFSFSLSARRITAIWTHMLTNKRFSTTCSHLTTWLSCAPKVGLSSVRTSKRVLGRPGTVAIDTPSVPGAGHRHCQPSCILYEATGPSLIARGFTQNGVVNIGTISARAKLKQGPVSNPFRDRLSSFFARLFSETFGTGTIWRRGTEIKHQIQHGTFEHTRVTKSEANNMKTFNLKQYGKQTSTYITLAYRAGKYYKFSP